MSLSSITEPLGTPDAFWSAMDHAFVRARGQTRKTPAKKLHWRTSEFRTNLNYNLLTHRRLVVEDVSLLLSRELMRLLDQESGQPQYRDFLREGVIVPALRESVSSFEELADAMLRHKQYQDLGPDLLHTFAKSLDGTNPEVACTTTEENRQLMHELVENKFLEREAWAEVGLGAFSSRLTDYVPQATAENRSDFYRRTEFWEFADRLDEKKEHALAQLIRAQISVLSLGVVATNLNLHSIFPAPYADHVDRVFGTHRPWHIRDDQMMVPERSILDHDLNAIQRDIRILASYLTPDQVWEIRESDEFHDYLKGVRRADELEPRASCAALLDTMRIYYRHLEVALGARLQGEHTEWTRLRSLSRWVSRTERTVPGAVGLISNIVTGFSGMPPLTGLVLSTVPAGLMSACLHLYSRHIKADQQRLDSRARSSAGTLVRPSGSLAVELYGPVDLRDWTGSAGSVT